MARLPDRSSRFLLISTFIICLLILFIDFRFNTFKPLQNFYNSSSIFIQIFSKDFIASPIYRSISSIWDTKRTKDEIQVLKEELDMQLIENYVISNQEILNRNFFFDISNLEKTNLDLIPAKVESFDVNIKDRLQVLEVSEPPERKPGIKVDDVDALVDKLKNEAKVL